MQTATQPRTNGANGPQTQYAESPPSLLDSVIGATAAHRHSLEDIHRMAQTAAKSRMFKMDECQIETLMQLCQAEGIEPIKALAMYDVFDGKPAMKSVYMLARHQASGGIYRWGVTSDTECECFFSHKAACPEGITIRWTIEDAKAAGLVGKNNWRGYAEDMLVWRVVSRGVKRSNPACLFGLDLPEPAEAPDPVKGGEQRSALIETLAKRRERPEPGNRVAETVADLKANGVGVIPPAEEVETPPVKLDHPIGKPAAEPTTEWGRVIADVCLDANKALAEAAEQTPSNLKLREPLKLQQVINGVVKRYVEKGVISEDALKENGRRNNQKVADAMSYLWSEDSEDLEAAIAKYVGDKLSEAMGPPPSQPKQGELPAS